MAGTITPKQQAYIRSLRGQVGLEAYDECLAAVFTRNPFTKQVDVPSIVTKAQASALISLLLKFKED